MRPQSSLGFLERARSPDLLEPVEQGDLTAPSDLTVHHNSLLKRRLTALQRKKEREEGIHNRDVRFRDVDAVVQDFELMMNDVVSTLGRIGTGAGNLDVEEITSKPLTESTSLANVGRAVGYVSTPSLPNTEVSIGGSSHSPAAPMPPPGSHMYEQMMQKAAGIGSSPSGNNATTLGGGPRKIPGIKGSLQERIQQYRDNPELKQEMMKRVDQRLREQKQKSIAATKGRRNIVKDNKEQMGTFTPENAKRDLKRKMKQRENKLAMMKEYKEASAELQYIQACEKAEVEYYPPRQDNLTPSGKGKRGGSPTRPARDVIEANKIVLSPRTMHQQRLRRLEDKFERQQQVYDRIVAYDKQIASGDKVNSIENPDNPFYIPGYSRNRAQFRAPSSPTAKRLRPLTALKELQSSTTKPQGHVRVKPPRSLLFQKYTRLPHRTPQPRRTKRESEVLPPRAQSTIPPKSAPMYDHEAMGKGKGKGKGTLSGQPQTPIHTPQQDIEQASTGNQGSDDGDGGEREGIAVSVDMSVASSTPSLPVARRLQMMAGEGNRPISRSVSASGMTTPDLERAIAATGSPLVQRPSNATRSSTSLSIDTNTTPAKKGVEWAPEVYSPVVGRAVQRSSSSQVLRQQKQSRSTNVL